MVIVRNLGVYIALFFSISSLAMDPPPPAAGTFDFGKKLDLTEMVAGIKTRPKDLYTLAYLSGEIRSFLCLENADYILSREGISEEGLINCLELYDKKITMILNNSQQIFDLDADILSIIFAFLSPKDCCSFHLVNRKFAAVTPSSSIKIRFYETVAEAMKYRKLAIIDTIDGLLIRKQLVDIKDVAAVIAELRKGIKAELKLDDCHPNWLFAYKLNMALIIFIDLAKQNGKSEDYDYGRQKLINYDQVLEKCMDNIDNFKDKYAVDQCYFPANGDWDKPRMAGCEPCQLIWAMVLRCCFGPESYVEENLQHSDVKMRAYNIARKWNLKNLWDFEAKKDR